MNPPSPIGTTRTSKPRTSAHCCALWSVEGNSASVSTTSVPSENSSGAERRHCIVQCTLGCMMHVPGGAPKSGAIKRSPRYSGSAHHPTASSEPGRQWFGTRFHASTPSRRQSSVNASIIAGTVRGISPCVNARSSMASSGTKKASRRSSMLGEG